MFRDDVIEFIRNDRDAACGAHEHPLLYRHAEALISKGHTPEAVADEVARLFNLSAHRKAAVLGNLTQHAAAVERGRRHKTLIRLGTP
ncbi:MAG: hypothetical protein QG661_3125 [Actinomycetota bacterium]|jgi:hypothetical protein|nr:hypothetical protein [Actinomycetota bacterium]